MSTISFWAGMVVVIRAEAPMMSARSSSARRTKSSGFTSRPRSWTSKPAALSMVMAMSLPISCTSPLTVPMTMTPRFWVAPPTQQARLDHAHGALHGACRQHQLGQEDLAGGEPVADFAHAGGQGVHQRRGLGAVLQRRGGEFGSLCGVAGLYRADQFVSVLINRPPSSR